ncbi:MAG: hypothetical protein ABI151_00770 [Chitinophagaceae bacterium]
MKKTILYSIFGMLVLLGCRKSDNEKIPALYRVPTPSLKLDKASDAFISPGAPATFKGKVIVDLFFKTDVPPQKFDFVIMKNNNPATVKTFKAGITTFPTTVDFSGQQLIDLFGSPIADGDLFTVGIDVTTQAGQLFHAFPAVGVGYGTGVANEAGGVSTSLQFLKPCTFVSSLYAGDFTVVSDEWQDYKAGAVIPVKLVSANQISFEYAVDAGTAKPIILTINPANNVITVAKQVYGSYGADEYSAEAAANSGSSVNPCDLSLSVKLTHSSNGPVGAFTIKLKKK